MVRSNGGEPSALGTAATIVALGFVGSRVLGLARNMALGGVFGTSPELDAYFAAFRLPDVIFQLLAGAALASAFIPTFSTYLTKGELQEAWKLASIVLNLVALGTMFLALAAFMLAPWLVPLTVPGFLPEHQQLTVLLTRIMLLSPVFFCLSGILSGILQARHHFLFPAVAPLLYNLAIIIGTLLLSGPLGIVGPAVGVAVGSALHLVVQVPALRRSGMVYRAALTFDHPGVREVLRLMGPRVLGFAAIQVNWLVTTALASMLAAGSLAALNYAWALAVLPITVFGVAIATAAFPAMAEQAAQQRQEALGHTLSASLRLILFLTIPASLGLLLLRDPLIALVFQRGLFSQASAQAVAWALLFYALGLWALSAQEVVTRGFYALHDTRTPLFFSLGAMVLHLLLCLSLVSPLGHGGLALALSLSGTLEALGLLLVLRGRVTAWQGAPLLASMGRTGAASVAMTLALSAFLRISLPLLSPRGMVWFQGLGGVTVGALAFFGAAWALRSEEIGIFRRYTAQLLRRVETPLAPGEAEDEATL